MMLPLLIAIMIAGAAAAWLAERFGPQWPYRTALLTLLADAATVAAGLPEHWRTAGMSRWLIDFKAPWFTRFGISLHLAMDGLSLLLVGLTLLLSLIALESADREINERRGFFFFNLLLCLAGILGVFLAEDLFLFFFCWEAMIVPMYFLILVWGHENRLYAAAKFFLFTQVSSLVMLVAIVALAFYYHDETGVYSFDYFDLSRQPVPPKIGFWLMLGFFTAFAVKLPAVPVHTWLADAHTQAPTAGSIVLAGLMLKTGAYGLIRFVVPLFPEASRQFAPFALALGAVSVLYAAVLAFAQTDMKRLIACTSISHMGFVTLGVFAGNAFALQGAVVTLVAHGLSAAALFMIAGALQARLHTRDLAAMGGFWAAAPRLSGCLLFFAVATLGLPGLGNFIGEFLVLLGLYQTDPVITAVSALVLILAPAYALRLVQKTAYGPTAPAAAPADFGRSELAVSVLLMLATLWLGLHPDTVLALSAAFPP